MTVSTDEAGRLPERCEGCGQLATIQDLGKFTDPPGTERWYCDECGAPGKERDHMSPGDRVAAIRAIKDASPNRPDEAARSSFPDAAKLRGRSPREIDSARERQDAYKRWKRFGVAMSDLDLRAAAQYAQIVGDSRAEREIDNELAVREGAER